MKASKILFMAIVLSYVLGLPYHGYTQDHDQTLMYPAPTVELTYMKEPFTKELIIKKYFRDNQLVPIKIELLKPQMSDPKEKDLYLTIEHVQVSFAIHEDVALRSALHPGHLILIPISWPQGFTLEQGSRIVFVVKYNYHLKDQVVAKGEIIEQIRF